MESCHLSTSPRAAGKAIWKPLQKALFLSFFSQDETSQPKKGGAETYVILVKTSLKWPFSELIVLLIHMLLIHVQRCIVFRNIS